MPRQRLTSLRDGSVVPLQLKAERRRRVLGRPSYYGAVPLPKTLGWKKRIQVKVRGSRNHLQALRRRENRAARGCRGGRIGLVSAQQPQSATSWVLLSPAFLPQPDLGIRTSLNSPVTSQLSLGPWRMLCFLSELFLAASCSPVELQVSSSPSIAPICPLCRGEPWFVQLLQAPSWISACSGINPLQTQISPGFCFSRI